MALSDATYTALKAAVATELAKSNLTASVPDFIYRAELRLFRRLRLLGGEASQTGTLTAGTATLSRPTGHRETQAIYIGSDPIYTLKLVSPDELFRSGLASESGTPLLVAVIGSTFRFAPVPDSAYAYAIHYTASPSHLKDASTNWLLQTAADLYLYASCLEAEAFLKNDSRIMVWREFVDEAIANLEMDDERARWSGTVMIPRAG